MFLARIFVLIAMIQGVCAQDQQPNPKSIISSLNPAAQALILSAAAAGQEKPADQPQKVISNAEAHNLLELLEDSTKRQKLISNLKKSVGRSDKEGLSPEGVLFSFKEWIKTENLMFVGIAILRISFIILVFCMLWHSLNKFVDYYAKRIPVVRRSGANSKEGSAVFKTVAPIIRSTFHWMLIVVTVLLVLSEMNINIMPIIYSFSVITLAISLGSQTLVKDLINGIMMLFEGNMAVGDAVIIGNHAGIVETISLRCVHLRHGTGELQTIPFSEVTNVINCSRDFNVVDIQFAVSYQADLGTVNEALRSVYGLLKKDEKFKSYIIGDLNIYGISGFNEWGAMIHAGVKINPDPAKYFLNEFNRLLLLELQKRQIPLPVTMLLASDTKDPKPVSA
jgi:small-conductance mechanosensitive channel